MLRILFSICMLSVALCILDHPAMAADKQIQLKLDTAKEGDTLTLKKGIYYEPIVIDQPMTLIGSEGVIFQACSSQPMITVKGNNVHLKNITIKTCNENTSPSSILIRGKNHHLEELTIYTHGVGIQLDAAEESLFQNIKIIGQREENGIDLWESEANTFENNEIDQAQDGFYLENSHSNRLIHNTIRNSRYGVHVMFSNNITIKENISKQNNTGAMIMGSSNSLIAANKLTEDNQNVNAQGLLLYDVHRSMIEDNIISNNRVGLYMEDSSENQVRRNEFSANFIGAQINKISKNTMERNAFFSNVIELQAKEETNNIIQRNYWDAASKLDSNADGYSNLPYHADPYFLNLIKDVPEYQLFFQHPGMQLLQKMLKSPEELLVSDTSPLMEYNIHHQSKNQGEPAILWITSFVLIITSLSIIYFGRRKL